MAKKIGVSPEVSNGTDTPVEQAIASSPARKSESKAERFRRLANRRVPAALKRLGAVANLGNKSQYECTEEQRDKLLQALASAFDDITSAFCGGGVKSEPFSL